MKIKLPGKDVSVRLFERVETVDSQYDIFDVGLVSRLTALSTLWSLVARSPMAKSLVKAMDDKAAEKKAEEPVLKIA